MKWKKSSKEHDKHQLGGILSVRFSLSSSLVIFSPILLCFTTTHHLWSKSSFATQLEQALRRCSTFFVCLTIWLFNYEVENLPSTRRLLDKSDARSVECQRTCLLSGCDCTDGCNESMNDAKSRRHNLIENKMLSRSV